MAETEEKKEDAPTWSSLEWALFGLFCIVTFLIGKVAVTLLLS